MKTIAVIVFAVVVFTSFTGIVCNEGTKGGQKQNVCQGIGEACTREYRPVCGSDGTSYSNKCMFCSAKNKGANIELLYEGKCSPENDCRQFKDTNFCTMEYVPICGSDAVSHPNKCAFCSAKNNAKPWLTFVSHGECPKKG
ncbi:double-headed protease inhibitor, submandibular gland-like [Dendropsophus ebraccatus]|uniref:double-headed protease inhibitor, submandibular gland-like n=1 Tax=Dendropsophus ebraccatus TaxID=150705 RepID=UPI00383166AC